MKEGRGCYIYLIESDPGECAKEKKAEKEGKKIEYTEKQITLIKTLHSPSGQVHHGYKLSAKADVDHYLIRDFETVTEHDAGNGKNSFRTALSLERADSRL